MERKLFLLEKKVINSLSLGEFNRLRYEANKVLEEISPFLYRGDYKSWMEKLSIGASHPSNFLVAKSLGSSFTFTVLPTLLITHDHPELYFDIPRKELLDCHWMVYYAASKIYKENLLKDNKTDDENLLVETLKGQKVKPDKETKK